MKERNYSLDLMRIFLSLCVIALHSYNYFGETWFHFDLLAPVFFIAADGMFYIASGYFNLEKEFNNITEIKKYYKNKILYVLFPFLAFVFIWLIWDYVHLHETFDFLEILSLFYVSIMNTSADGHMWFMYPLFGLLLGTPFLSKMLHNMNDKELKLLWRIALCFNILQYFFCYDLGISFRVLAWFLDGWPIYYFVGYYYRHIIVKESKLKWSLIGFAGLVITILGMQGDIPFLKSFFGATDIQPAFTLLCVGCFLFWDKAIKIKEGKLSKVITFLSRNTYLIYLYHMRGIEYAARKLPVGDPCFSTGLLVVFGTFVVSLAAAYVTNLCIKPVQKLIDKFWVIK